MVQQRPLAEKVEQLCQHLLPDASPELAQRLGDVVAQLRAPLQVAVTGRLSAGKSTLVNALVGRRVAPTGAGECTGLVTRYTAGATDGVEVVLGNGRRVRLGLDASGMVPAQIPTRVGVDRRDVSHLEVSLTSHLLRGMTVIDTPGLGALDREPLAGVAHSAVRSAEAVLHVLTHTLRGEDTAALAALSTERFTADTAGRPPGAASVLAVLNKADTVTPDHDGATVWETAQARAAEQARLLGVRVVDVLPVVGLLAQTCESGAFTDADADALRLLAAEPQTTRTTRLLSAELFLGMDCALDTATRAALLDKLDLYGVVCVLRLLHADPQVCTARIRAALYAASGIAAVRQRLHSVIGARTDVLKAAAGVRAVTAAAQSCATASERAAVTDGLERLLRLPQAHELRVAEVISLLTAELVHLPADLTAEVLRLGSAEEPAERLGLSTATAQELAALALHRARWWRSFATDGATPAQARVAHVVHRAYFLMWEQLAARGHP